MTDRDTPYAALTLAMKVSPTGTEQEAFTNMYNKMFADGLTSKEITIGVTEAVLDGLRHGNWPKEK